MGAGVFPGCSRVVKGGLGLVMEMGSFHPMLMAILLLLSLFGRLMRYSASLNLHPLFDVIPDCYRQYYFHFDDYYCYYPTDHYSLTPPNFYFDNFNPDQFSQHPPQQVPLVDYFTSVIEAFCRCLHFELFIIDFTISEDFVHLNLTIMVIVILYPFFIPLAVSHHVNLSTLHQWHLLALWGRSNLMELSLLRFLSHLEVSRDFQVNFDLYSHLCLRSFRSGQVNLLRVFH